MAWCGGTQPCGGHGKRLWFAWPFKASLITSTTALEKDKSIDRSTWSQYNNSNNADLSSLTYHQHYPALEMDKSIGRSYVNMWPWKPHLSPRHWVSQHRIGQDYWQVHKWKGQNAAQSLGEVATQRLNCQSWRRWPPGLLTDKLSSTQGGRVGIFFYYFEPSLLSKARHQRKVLLQWAMVLLQLDITMSVTNRKLPIDAHHIVIRLDNLLQHLIQ